MAFDVEQVRKMNEGVLDEFRSQGGKVGGVFAGFSLLIVTVTGKKSGKAHEVPLVYLEDQGQVYIFGSKGGHPENPLWYDNLVAHPDVTVEIGTEKYPAKAVVLEGEERDRIFNKQATLMPNFAEYQAATPRKIPVVRLDKR